LGVRVRSLIRTLKLDTDGKIVTASSTLILRFTGVPGSLVKRDKLDPLTRAIDQKMCGDAQIGNFSEIWMGITIELIEEKAVNECNGDFSPTTVSVESELEEKEESLVF
jgi:hypothetical protein